MRRKLLTVLVLVPLGVLLIALAVANRQPVSLVLDPFGNSDTSLVLEAPLFLLLLIALAVGLILGGFATWLSQGKWRRSARTRGREATQWRRQVDRLERELETMDASAPRGRLAAD